MSNYLREIWQYRTMIASLVKRDLKSRYNGSVLGFFWMFLNPLLQLMVYTVVFSTIMRNGIDKFYLFLFVALVPWLFFATCLSGGTTVIFSEQDMVKKIYFPREILPLSFTISQFVNMLLSFIIIFVVVLISGVKQNPGALLFLPVVMLIEFILALGITFLVSSLNVFFRDLQHILGIISMAWMYATPVLYPLEMVPEGLRRYYLLNPMTPVTIAYRDILYYGRMPEMSTLSHAFAFAVVIYVIGHIVFSRLQRRFAEEL